MVPQLCIADSSLGIVQFRYAWLAGELQSMTCWGGWVEATKLTSHWIDLDCFRWTWFTHILPWFTFKPEQSWTVFVWSRFHRVFWTCPTAMAQVEPQIGPGRWDCAMEGTNPTDGSEAFATRRTSYTVESVCWGKPGPSHFSNGKTGRQRWQTSQNHATPNFSTHIHTLLIECRMLYKIHLLCRCSLNLWRFQVTYGRGLLKIFNTGKNFGFISPVFKGEDHEGPPLPSSVDEGSWLLLNVWLSI